MGSDVQSTVQRCSWPHAQRGLYGVFARQYQYVPLALDIEENAVRDRQARTLDGSVVVTNKRRFLSLL